MKASLKLREDGAAPLLRAKLPVALFSVPAVASLTAGDPADLRLSLATAVPALPSLRISYAPNRPSSPLSLALVLGSGPGGCPSPAAASAITMAVEVSAAGAVSFSLVLKPSLGDFAVRKRFDSAGSAPTSAAAAASGSEVTMRSSIPVRGGAAAVSVRWGVRIPAEVTAGGEDGAAALALRRLPFLVLGKIAVERQPPPPPASRAMAQEETSVEKTRRENERLRKDLDEQRAAATDKMTSASTVAAAGAAAGGRRRWLATARPLMRAGDS